MIRKYLLTATLLSAVASPAAAEITFNIEEPAQDSVRSGIGLISGWAVSDVGIESIEAFMNGESLGFIPYGSPRGDVEAAFPHIPGSDKSGWAMKWGYSLAGEGQQTLTVVVTEEGGATASKEVTFEAIRFDSEFVANPADVVTAGAALDSPEDGRLVITGAMVEGRAVDIELAWDTGAQQFLIDRIQYDGEPKTLQSPRASAGVNRTVDAGSAVSITGDGSDPDGYISSHRWTQVSGPTVSLQNPEDWTVYFVAPAEASTVRLRLEVTDDDGLSDSDDVVVVIAEPEPENKAPTVSVGPDFIAAINESVSITGTGNDSDGEIVRWAWSWQGGIGLDLIDAKTSTVRFTAPNKEGYTRLRLTVTDDDGATAYDEILVTYRDPTPANQAPTANAGSNRTVAVNDDVTITGSGSDSDGSIVNWSWTQVSGTIVSLSGANTQQVSFKAPGAATTIRLRLTVTDDDGAMDGDDVLITVEAPDSGGGGGGGFSETVTGDTVQSMLDDINAARGQGRYCGSDWYDAQPPFSWSSSLAEIAMVHSMDMAAQGYFSHTSADGTSMGERVFPYWSGNRVGENIATSGIDRSDAYVVQMWLDSPGHCALIMSPNFTHAGVGSGHDPEGGWTNNGYTFYYFWTLDFGG